MAMVRAPAPELMSRLLRILVLSLAFDTARADAEHHVAGASFAGEFDEYVPAVSIPDKWMLETEDEVNSAGRYVMQRVCRGASFKSHVILSLLHLAATKGITAVATTRSFVHDLGQDMTALHCAVMHARLDFVDALLNAGANVSALGRGRSPNGEISLISPLSAAMIEAGRISQSLDRAQRVDKGPGLVPVVKRLLDAGAGETGEEEAIVLDHARILAEDGWDAFALFVQEWRREHGLDEEDVAYVDDEKWAQEEEEEEKEKLSPHWREEEEEEKRNLKGEL